MNQAKTRSKTKRILIGLCVAISVTAALFFAGSAFVVYLFQLLFDDLDSFFEEARVERIIPDKNTAKLMPEGFENVYLMMPDTELQEIRTNISFDDEPQSPRLLYIEKPRDKVFSSVLYEAVPRIVPDYPLFDKGDYTQRVGNVRFYSTTDKPTVLAFLKKSILKYGGLFENFYVGGDACLAWDTGDNRVFLSWRSPEEKDESERGPSMLLLLFHRGEYPPPFWGSDSEDRTALKRAFAPYQATIDEALRELATSGTPASPEKSVEPDTGTSRLMPDGFENLHLKMTRDNLLSARPNASWVGDPVLGHVEEKPKEGIFSSARYDVVPGLPTRLLDLDRTPRFVSVLFRGEVEEKEALEFLRQCVLKYGSVSWRGGNVGKRRVTLNWDVEPSSSIFVTIDLPKPQQKQEISLRIWPSDSFKIWNLTAGNSLDEEDLKKLFEPFQPTLDQALKELAAREESARKEKAAREEVARDEKAKQRWTRIALYSGLGVVVLLAAFLIYRRIGRKPKPLPE